MRIIAGLAMAGACAFMCPGVANAAEKLEIGPAPTWVKPAAIPSDRGETSQAAVRLLLQDQQYDLKPGRQTYYFENAMRIQTPQGLAAGTISLSWNPDTSSATVHKLQIRRGEQVIDVLASGQSFTVLRRESNLENAMLDGVLTATIQPEGLQVGDIIDFAASITTSDPALKDHIETIGGGWNGIPVGRAHLRAQWPSAFDLSIRQDPALPPVKTVRKDGLSSIDLSIENLQPVAPPENSPPRFGIRRLIEMSDFHSWADLAALLTPLYEKASTLPPQGKLRAEIERIRALSPDPKIRAEAALALVQNRVRYVFLGMNDGGLVPADAETTWSRRFGDCKGKTALLLALLHALDIDAEPVIVSSKFGDGMDQHLPMISWFDHVLVRTTIEGQVYWLDGTRMGDTRLDTLPVPFFRWGLPLAASGGKLVSMVPSPPDEPLIATTVHIDATAGLSVPAPTHIELVMRGDAATALNLQLSNLTPDALDRQLRDYWKEQYSFIEVKKTSAAYDTERRVETLVMDGEARMDWSGGSYETDGVSVGYQADFSRDPGPDYDAPFAVSYPYYSRNVETILLPPGRFTIDNDGDIDRTVAGITYRRHASISGNRFTVEETERTVAPEFPAAEAPAAQTALRELWRKTVYLKKPEDYRPTDKELAAAMQTEPTTAAGFIDRGNMLLDRELYDEAIADFTKALTLDPKDAMALADRGIAYAWKGNGAEAKKDLDAAAAIDPRNVVIYRARGLMALHAQANSEAIAAFTRALDLAPGDAFSLYYRAEAYRAMGDNEHAAADAGEVIEQDPTWVEAYLLRANAFRSLGKQKETVAVAEALAAANPANAYAHVTAAMIYDACHRDAEAMREFDRAIAIQPSTFIYLNRNRARPKSDFAGRQTDIDAMKKLDPDSTDMIEAQARLQEDRGHYAEAIKTWSALIEKTPNDGNALVRRGIDYARMDQATLAERDFDAARRLTTTATDLNNLCWIKATAGVSLPSALEDCEAALAKQPGTAAYLDSRALVLLRLGRIDEAIATYDQALAKNPNLPASLFGRAVAEARKGEKEKSDRDRQAALKADPDVESDFEDFGVRILSEKEA